MMKKGDKNEYAIKKLMEEILWKSKLQQRKLKS